MVLAVCRSVLGPSSDADDASQAVLLTLAQKASSTHVRRHLVGWLPRVAWYIAARAAQARAIRRRHEQEAAKMRPEMATDAAPAIPLEALHAGLAAEAGEILETLCAVGKARRGNGEGTFLP